MVGPRRTCTIVDAGVRKPLDLKIQVPVESMVEPEQSAGTPTRSTRSPAARRRARSIWPAIYPRAARAGPRAPLDDRLRQQPPRRRAPRAAAQRAGQRRPPRGRAAGEIARAHHGSLAREERTVVEELLKAGELPCLVATSSLELGHRHGRRRPRAPGRVAEVGRRAACSASAAPGTASATPPRAGSSRSSAPTCSSARSSRSCMREGAIEPTVVPRNALDVLAQQIVAIAASADDRSRSRVDELYALVTRTHSYAELPRDAARERARHARRPLPVAGVRRAAPAHRLGPRRAARSARARARASSRSRTRGRSPTAACSRSRCPTAAASASSTRRWSTRRARARRSCSARRRGGSRRSAATA